VAGNSYKPSPISVLLFVQRAKMAGCADVTVLWDTQQRECYEGTSYRCYRYSRNDRTHPHTDSLRVDHSERPRSFPQNIFQHKHHVMGLSYAFHPPPTHQAATDRAPVAITFLTRSILAFFVVPPGICWGRTPIGPRTLLSRPLCHIIGR
jgi:hypothetical protein